MVFNWKIGADIEVFLRDKKTKKIVTAEGIIKGTKTEPYNFDKKDKFFATSLDNVMAEFCIPPTTTSAEFHANIKKALDYINGAIPKELEAFPTPAAYIDEKYLQTENAKLFGCEPDFNAWTLSENAAPGSGSNLRSCGGHVHIGYDEPSEFVNTMLIKACDVFIGLPSILLEEENDRKALYGKAGAFRHKSYGVEYRTVSNFYLKSESLTNWLYGNVRAAIDFVNSGGCNMLGPEEKEDIVNAINYNDKELAGRLIDNFGVNIAA